MKSLEIDCVRHRKEIMPLKKKTTNLLFLEKNIPKKLNKSSEVIPDNREKKTPIMVNLEVKRLNKRYERLY